MATLRLQYDFYAAEQRARRLELKRAAAHLLPGLAPMAPGRELQPGANDETAEDLARAWLNYARANRSAWCECPEDPSTWIYFENPNGPSHGWACQRCKRITQTG